MQMGNDEILVFWVFSVEKETQELFFFAYLTLCSRSNCYMNGVELQFCVMYHTGNWTEKPETKTSPEHQQQQQQLNYPKNETKKMLLADRLVDEEISIESA